MISPRTPSVFRIILTDYYTLLAAMLTFPVLVMVILLIVIPLAIETKQMANVQGLVVVLMGIGLWAIVFGGALALRISMICSAFNDGQELRGQITEVMFTGNNGWVKYTYVYMGTPFISSNRIVRNGRTRQFAPGSQAQVMVDTGDPKRAFLRDIYV